MIRGGHGLSFPIATQKARQQPTTSASCSWAFGLAVEAGCFQPQGGGGRVARMGQVQMKGSPTRESQEGENGSGGHHGMRRRSTPPLPALSQWFERCSAWGAVVLLPGALAGLLGAAQLTGSAPAGPSPPALAGLLQVGWPVLAADSHLRRLGWSPAPLRQSDALDRQLAGNSLASLSDCSGTGLGFCRYDYRRAAVNLSVITLPEQALPEQVIAEQGLPEQPLSKQAERERAGPVAPVTVTPAQKRSEANPVAPNQMGAKQGEAKQMEAKQLEPKPAGATGGARVVRWLDADSGRTWGLCAGSVLPHQLVPCPEP